MNIDKRATTSFAKRASRKHSPIAAWEKIEFTPVCLTATGGVVHKLRTTVSRNRLDGIAEEDDRGMLK